MRGKNNFRCMQDLYIFTVRRELWRSHACPAVGSETSVYSIQSSSEKRYLYLYLSEKQQRNYILNIQPLFYGVKQRCWQTRGEELQGSQGSLSVLRALPLSCGIKQLWDVKPQPFSFPHSSLIPLFLRSLILRPQEPHPPRPTELPLIIDSKKIHIQYTHWHRCPTVCIKLSVISSSIPEQHHMGS